MSNPGWTMDTQGQRVMVGLTADETAEYQGLLNVSAGVSCEEMQARFVLLEHKHEAALKALAPADQRQPDQPPASTVAPGSNPPIDEDAT